MKLLFDQNLSYRLCRELADLFPGSEQVARAGLADADDAEIWNYAGQRGLVVVTHDADFAEMAGPAGCPAQDRVVAMRQSADHRNRPASA